MLNKSQRGVAVFEFIAAFFAFIFTLALFYSSFGIVHSSILNSIAARNYAFSVIKNRYDINFHRECVSGGECLALSQSEETGYFRREMRFFATTELQEGKPDFIAPLRSIDFSPINPERQGAIGVNLYRNEENDPYFGLTENNWRERIQVGEQDDLRTAKVYLKQGYGICLNARCGDN